VRRSPVGVLGIVQTRHVKRDRDAYSRPKAEASRAPDADDRAVVVQPKHVATTGERRLLSRSERIMLARFARLASIVIR
jgi:hypothetical protein